MYRVHEKLNRKIRFLSFYFGGKEIQIIFDLAHTHLILTKLELMQNDEVLYHKPRLVYISILWLDKIHNTLFYLGDFWSTWCTTANLEFAHAISHYKMMILQLWHYRIYRTRNNKNLTIFQLCRKDLPQNKNLKNILNDIQK